MKQNIMIKCCRERQKIAANQNKEIVAIVGVFGGGGYVTQQLYSPIVLICAFVSSSAET